MNPPYRTPLSVNDLRGLGIPEPWTFGIADRTRWSEMDPLSHTNNAAYLSWFENVRLEWLKQRRFRFFGPDQPRIVIRQVGIDFIGEIKMDEAYVTTLRVRDYRTTSFTMDYGVFALRDTGPALCTTSHAVLVLLKPDMTGKTPLTKEQIRILTEQDGAKKAG